MSKKKKLGLLAGSTAVTTATTAHAMKKEADKTTYTAELMSAIKTRKMGFYEKYIKRGMDVICASAAILCFSPIYAGVALLVKIKLGSPVIFTQDRPGLVDKNGPSSTSGRDFNLAINAAFLTSTLSNPKVVEMQRMSFV